MNQTATPAPSSASAAVRWTLVGVLLAIVVAIVTFAAMPKPKEELPSPVAKSVAVRVAVAAAADVTETIEYPARLEAEQDVELAPEHNGLIETILVREGDAVTNGQVLLRLDRRSQQAMLDRAEVSLRQAANDLARWEELRKSGSVSQSDYEAMVIRRDLAAVALREAAAELDRRELRSPLDGIVEGRAAEPGEQAKSGMPVFRVVSTARVKVVAHVPERDVGSLQAGQVVPFVCDTLANQRFEGRLTFVASAADPRSNTFRVELEAANPERQLRPGFVARLFLAPRLLRQVIALPLAAVVPEKGSYLVYTVVDGHAIRRLVKLGPVLGDQVVIAEGLQAGETVIVEGQRMVSDGEAVHLPAAPQAAPESP
jgi:membrane fusion protein (multidrug efflux system)